MISGAWLIVWHLLASACASFFLPDPYSSWVQESFMAVFTFILITREAHFHLLGFSIRESTEFPFEGVCCLIFTCPQKNFYPLIVDTLCFSPENHYYFSSSAWFSVWNLRHFVVSLFFSQAWIISTLV